MKFIKKSILILGMLAALTVPAVAQLGSPEVIYSAAYHSPGGATNITTGFTNTLTFRESPKTTMSFELRTTAVSANASNNVALRIFPAFTRSSAATANSHYIVIAPQTNGTELVTVTNVTAFGAPYYAFQLESSSGNLVTFSNVSIRVYHKTP